MEYEALEIKNDGAVTWLTLNRPHNLNALSAQMVAELEDFLHRLPKQTDTRVVVMKHLFVTLTWRPREQRERE